MSVPSHMQDTASAQDAPSAVMANGDGAPEAPAAAAADPPQLTDQTHYVRPSKIIMVRCIDAWLPSTC